jgi:hypothetical protein
MTKRTLSGDPITGSDSAVRGGGTMAFTTTSSLDCASFSISTALLRIARSHSA